MKLVCLFGHRWNGCVCRRCGTKAHACRKGVNLWDASEMDADAEKVLSAIIERNAHLHFLATGQRADEEWW